MVNLNQYIYKVKLVCKGSCMCKQESLLEIYISGARYLSDKTNLQGQIYKG